MRRWIWAALAAIALALLLGRDWVAAIWQAFSVESMNEVTAYLRGFGVWTPLMSLLLMVFQSVIAPLPGSMVAAANGIVFGIWWGTLLSWVGGMLGAAVSFGLARWLGQDAVARLVGRARLDRANELSKRDGFWIVLAARLMPLVSFDFVSYLAGLSQMRFSQFLLATAVGMLPGTFAWTAIGHDLAQAQTSTWRLSFLALFAVAALLGGRWWLGRNRVRLGLDQE